MTNPLTPLEAAQLAACLTASQDAQAIHNAQRALATAHRTGRGLVDAERDLSAARAQAANRRLTASRVVGTAQRDMGQVAA